ncbi:MAG: amidohydrolase family protein [bacterium]|nr:amidohydrolase family protein [bacterium]
MTDKRFKLIRGKFLLPMTEGMPRIKDGYVLIDGSVIEEAGKWTDEIAESIISRCGNELQVIGMDDKDEIKPSDIPMLPGVVMPGFVKAHGHDHESPLIGIAKDEPLTSWLDHAVNLFTGFMNENRDMLTSHFGKSPNYVTYVKARVDDIYYGITSSMVHHCNHGKYHVGDIVKANIDAGTKMIIAVGAQDRNYDSRILDTPEIAVERMNRYYAEFKDAPRTRIIPGPDQDFSNGPEQLKALKKWANDHGTLIHIHSSEEPKTTKWFTEEYGMTPVEYFNSIGFLDENAVLAHQVNCTEHDVEILRDTKTVIVHNPLANTILGSGMPPVMKMMAEGIPVLISTDGSGSADNQNILSAARLASQYQKALNKDASLLPVETLLSKITKEPAKYLRFNTGILEKGRDADVIFLDMTAPNVTPTRITNVAENLIWASNGNEVRYVIANGKVLMNDRKLVTLDEETIKKEVLELSEMFDEYAKTAPEIRQTGAHKL